MSDPLFVGDVGAEIEVESKKRDLTGYTVTMTLVRPDGTTPATAISCTVDSTGKLATGLTRAGDLTVPKTYEVILQATQGAVTFHVGTAHLTVLPVPSGTPDGP